MFHPSVSSRSHAPVGQSAARSMVMLSTLYSVPALEAVLAGAPSYCVSPPSPVPRPIVLVYTDDVLAPRAQP